MESRFWSTYSRGTAVATVTVRLMYVGSLEEERSGGQCWEKHPYMGIQRAQQRIYSVFMVMRLSFFLFVLISIINLPFSSQNGRQCCLAALDLNRPAGRKCTGWCRHQHRAVNEQRETRDAMKVTKTHFIAAFVHPVCVYVYVWIPAMLEMCLRPSNWKHCSSFN